MLCIGHRGAAGHEPENTLLSVAKALELGADWVEVDVFAVGGELVVIHDWYLERTTDGRGPVMNMSFAELRRLDAGKGQRIPTLEEVVAAVRGRAGINIELKGPGTAGPVVERVRSMFADGWEPDAVLVSSFDQRALRKVRRLEQRIPLGALLVGLPLDDAAFAEALGAVSVHPSVEFIDRRFVDDAHGRGLRVYPFTVNHPHDIARMRALGVDGVFTDYPDRVAGT